MRRGRGNGLPVCGRTCRHVPAPRSPRPQSDPSIHCIALTGPLRQSTGACSNGRAYCICFSPSVQVLATMETPTALSSRLSAELPAQRLVQWERGAWQLTLPAKRILLFLSSSSPSPGDEDAEEWPELYRSSHPSYHCVGGQTPSPSPPSLPPQLPPYHTG